MLRISVVGSTPCRYVRPLPPDEVILHNLRAADARFDAAARTHRRDSCDYQREKATLLKWDDAVHNLR